MGAGMTSHNGETDQHARLKRLASSNANKCFAICDETIAALMRRGSDSKQSVNVAKFSKPACAHIIRACGVLMRSSPNLTRKASLRSVTAVTRASYVSLRTLQNRLYDCTKFDKLIRYRCANLFFLVLPEELFRDPEIPVGWGALVESNGALTLARKPIWHETAQEDRIRLLHRIAVAGTRAPNRNLHDPGVFLQTP